MAYDKQLLARQRYGHEKGCRLAGRPAAPVTTAEHAAVVTLLWRQSRFTKVKNLDVRKHNSFAISFC
jgi:hypothetical protein